jgi:hypothetical protein
MNYLFVHIISTLATQLYGRMIFFVVKYVTSLLNNCRIFSTYQLSNKYPHAVLVLLLKYKLARIIILGTWVVKNL